MSRFEQLAASYGGRLDRWPAAERTAAEALLRQSPGARLLLDEALALDRAIGDAGARSDRLRAPADGEAAALARLRAGVAARIAPAPRRAAQEALSWRGRLRGALSLDLPMLGFATGGGLALAAGLLIGWLQASAPPAPAGGLMSMLEPAPLQLLAE